jgi:hypothetical protein
LPEAEEITSSLRQPGQPERRQQHQQPVQQQRQQPERPVQRLQRGQQPELQQRVPVPEQLLPSCRKRTEQQQPSEQR